MSHLIKWQNQLHVPCVPEGFFSSRAVGCFGVATGRKIFGRRPVDLRSRGSQFKELSETGNRAWKVSGTHGRKRYKDVKINCLNTRI